MFDTVVLSFLVLLCIPLPVVVGMCVLILIGEKCGRPAILMTMVDWPWPTIYRRVENDESLPPIGSIADIANVDDTFR